MLVAHSMGGLVARMAVAQSAEALGAQAHHAGYSQRGFVRIRAGTARDLSLRAQDVDARSQAFGGIPRRKSIPHFSRALSHAAAAATTARASTCSTRATGRPMAPRPTRGCCAGRPRVRAALAPADSRMVHIVGVNQETVVGLRRTARRIRIRHGQKRRRHGAAVAGEAAQAQDPISWTKLHGNLANNRAGDSSHHRPRAPRAHRRLAAALARQGAGRCGTSTMRSCGWKAARRSIGGASRRPA